VENWEISHIGLWIKKRCRPKEKGTYPHKKSLLLLLLPNLLKDIYIIYILARKETDYAFYL